MKLQTLTFLLLLLVISSCSNEFDGQDGIKTVYFPNSEKIQQIVEYKDGKRIGELKEYYRDGTLKVRQYYKDDKLTDSAFFYHKNGKLQYFQYIKNSKKEGVWKKYNEQGKVYEEISFKNDMLDSTSTTYTYRTGKVLKRFNYNNGMKHGKQEEYYNNGNLKYICYYENNKPCKGTEEWRENGEKINNDFKISIKERNKILLENQLIYAITLENSQPDDEVYIISDKESDDCVMKLEKLIEDEDKNEFLMVYKVYPGGGFVMKTVKIAAFRKTKMGNIIIKTASINIAANNF